MATTYTDVQPQNLPRFLNAMKVIYGPIDALSPADTTFWTPPRLAEGHQGRYLWTDAFGVLHLLSLSAIVSEKRSTYATTVTARLIDAVRYTLARTPPGQACLHGGSDEYPLAGGLSIGKEADEDDPGGGGDGLYRHYLTMWIFTLNHRMVMGCVR